jgi:hypothetical protein
MVHESHRADAHSHQLLADRGAETAYTNIGDIELLQEIMDRPQGVPLSVVESGEI